MPRMLMLLITLAGSATPDAAASSDTAPVPFTSDDHGAIIIPVWIDEQGPFRFLLDTGSTISTISSRAAGALAIEPVARTPLTTSGGLAMRLVVQLGLVSVGSASRRGLLATVATEEELGRLGLRIDGVLGQDFLATYNFTVDYRRRTLVWGTADSATAEQLPLIRRDGRFVIRLAPGLHDVPLEMVPDTGASTFVLFARNGRPPRVDRWESGEVTISGLTGSQRARYAQLRELRVGSLTLRNVPVVVVPRDDTEHAGADGLLPLHLFKRVTFRLSEGYMAVER